MLSLANRDIFHNTTKRGQSLSPCSSSLRQSVAASTHRTLQAPSDWLALSSVDKSQQSARYETGNQTRRQKHHRCDSCQIQSVLLTLLSC